MNQFLFRFIKCIFILYFIYDMVSIVGKIHTEIKHSLPLHEETHQSNYTNAIKFNNHVNLILF